MTNIINSKAVFVDYATAAGVTQASIDLSVAGGIDTMSKLAFSSSYVPGQDSDAAFKEFLQALLNAAPNVGQLACWRQLHFTSHTLSVAAVRQQADSGADQRLRSMPAVERAERYSAQCDRLSSMKLEGELEPSHQVLDMAAQQYEQNCLVYLHPEKATKRGDELLGVKKVSTLSLEVSASVRIVQRSEDMTTSMDTHLKLLWALQRRALAYDQAHLITFKHSDVWIQHLLASMHSVSPPGFSSPGLTQVLAADHKLHLLMCEGSRSGIVAKTGGPRPLDTLLLALMHDARVAFHLLPLQASARAPVLPPRVVPEGAVAVLTSSALKRKRKKDAKLAREAASFVPVPAWVPPVPSARALKGAAKGSKGLKGKGKGKGKQAGPCRFFNGDRGCNFSAEECNAGAHVCSLCGGEHAAVACPRQ